MMQLIYIEQAVKNHPRTQRIIQRFKGRCHVVECSHYGEVFNPKNQDFRLQKQKPALILGKKEGKRLLSTPEGFGVGGSENYYFSHLLNCPYDCQYCFLQGMYQSANYVLFVNYEDFMQEIKDVLAVPSLVPRYFFSGYDGDSLAYEAVSGFLQEFLPFFAKHPTGILELRTKSANVNRLLECDPLDNVVVAFSFTPDVISQAIEVGVPTVEKRIAKIARLAERGWKIGLRFDPLIYATNFKELYRELMSVIFAHVPVAAIHSVSVGALRFPLKMYQKLVKMYPQEKLLAHPLERRDRQVSYSAELESRMKGEVIHCLQAYVPETLIFECQPS